jgi:DNA-binding SARP family transcriptional activator/predicted ATPase
MEVYLLGQFQVKVDGEVLTGLVHARLQELLAYLLLQKGKSVSRQQTAFLFWPDSSENQARTNLRNLLHRLRSALPAIDQFLIQGESYLQWRDDLDFTCDVIEFEAAVSGVKSAVMTSQVELYEDAVDLYGGDLLPACYSDWLLGERERLRQIYLTSTTRLAQLYEDQRAYSKAIATVQNLLRQDVLNENAYTWLMRLHALEGNRAQALHVYHTCAEVMWKELGVEPGPEVKSLYGQLLQTAAPTTPTMPLTTLISRQREWEQLTLEWRKITRHQPSADLILIQGEAGIGKTHLARAFIDWVARQGYTTVTAVCYENMQGLAYAPLAAWLGVLLQEDKRLFSKLPLASRTEISRLLPELHDLFPVLDIPPALTEKWQLLNFYEALLKCFSASRGPVLLFLDDAQWCDQDTLAWLAYLQSKPSGEKVVLVATTRSEAMDSHPAALQWIANSPQKIVLELGAFNESQTRQLVEQMLGKPVDDAQAQSIYEQSEGIPLYLTEMVRAGVHEKPPGSFSLPERVRSVIHWRLNRLSDSARQIIDLASVIGRSFSYELMRAASNVDERTLVDALDECWRQRILREQGSQGYDFSHDKIRQVNYAGLSHIRRRYLHGRAAGAFEQLAAQKPEVFSEAAARHLAAAGEYEKAAAYFERAAQSARNLYALEKTIALLEAALQNLPASPVNKPLAQRLYEQLGHALIATGQYTAGRQALASAMEYQEPVDPIVRSRLLRGIAQSWSAQQRYDEAGQAIHDALAELGAEPAAGLEEAWIQEWLETRLQQVDLLYFNNQPDEMQSVCNLLEGRLTQSGSLAQQSNFYTSLGMLNNRRERFSTSSESLLFARRALELSEKAGEPLLIARKHFSLGFNLLWYGNHSAAIAHLHQALEMAEKLGVTFVQNQALAYLAIAYRMAGDRQSAGELSQRNLVLAEAEHHPTYQGTALANLAWLAFHQGDLQEAERLSENALQNWQHGGYPMEWLAYFTLAAIALDRGDQQRAQACLTAILHPNQQRLPEDLETFLERAASQNREDLQQALAAARRQGYF